MEGTEHQFTDLAANPPSNAHQNHPVTNNSARTEKYNANRNENEASFFRSQTGKRYIFAVFGSLLVFIIILVIVFSIVLTRKPISSVIITTSTVSVPSTTTLSSIISVISGLNNVNIYPSGSYVASLSSFNDTSNSNITLLPLNDTLLNQIVNIDNSSLVFEAGRQQNLYFRIPGAIPNQISSRRKRQQISSIFTGLALQFIGSQNDDNIIIVPMNSGSPGITLIYTLPGDNSQVISLQLNIPSSICLQIADSCIGLSYNAYLLFNNNLLSNSVSNLANIACGDVCNQAYVNNLACSASCGAQCNGQQVAGSDTPVSRRYNMGTTKAEFEFIYQTFAIKDRILVWDDGVIPLFDSGCVGTQTERQVNLTFSSSDSTIRVDVEPDCDGGIHTAWYFTVVCP